MLKHSLVFAVVLVTILAAPRQKRFCNYPNSCCNNAQCGNCVSNCQTQCNTNNCGNSCVQNCNNCAQQCNQQCSTVSCNNACFNQCSNGPEKMALPILPILPIPQPPIVELPCNDQEEDCENNQPSIIINNNSTIINNVNVSTHVNIHNVVNTTNIINSPVFVNSTNINNIVINGGGSVKETERIETLNENEESSCCYVIHPRHCFIVNKTEDDMDLIKCVQKRHKECSSICSSPVVMIQPPHQPPLAIPPNYRQPAIYNPRPIVQPGQCQYTHHYPWVYCGNYQVQDCGNCYNCGGGYNPNHCSQQQNCPSQCRNNMFLTAPVRSGLECVPYSGGIQCY